jgi:NAD-dependent SIR2 family protein deacetylase
LYADFVRDPAARKRYWARSMIGWPRFSDARPNAAHRALASLETTGIVHGIVTQNVDALHCRAGSARVVELHGSLWHVRCLGCGERVARDELQARLIDLNPNFDASAAVMAPDGDAELPDDQVAAFCVPSCLSCDGVLKPDVVLFGENVPRAIVDRAWQLVEAAELLLVVGSSLAVFSGFRFVRGAAQRKLPVAIVNLGPTRGDMLATHRVSAPAGQVLPELARRLSSAGVE